MKTTRKQKPRIEVFLKIVLPCFAQFILMKKTGQVMVNIFVLATITSKHKKV